MLQPRGQFGPRSERGQACITDKFCEDLHLDLNSQWQGPWNGRPRQQRRPRECQGRVGPASVLLQSRFLSTKCFAREEYSRLVFVLSILVHDGLIGSRRVRDSAPVGLREQDLERGTIHHYRAREEL